MGKKIIPYIILSIFMIGSILLSINTNNMIRSYYSEFRGTNYLDIDYADNVYQQISAISFQNYKELNIINTNIKSYGQSITFGSFIIILYLHFILLSLNKKDKIIPPPIPKVKS